MSTGATPSGAVGGDDPRAETARRVRALVRAFAEPALDTIAQLVGGGGTAWVQELAGVRIELAEADPLGAMTLPAGEGEEGEGKTSESKRDRRVAPRQELGGPGSRARLGEAASKQSRRARGPRSDARGGDGAAEASPAPGARRTARRSVVPVRGPAAPIRLSRTVTPERRAARGFVAGAAGAGGPVAAAAVSAPETAGGRGRAQSQSGEERAPARTEAPQAAEPSGGAMALLGQLADGVLAARRVRSGDADARDTAPASREDLTEPAHRARESAGGATEGGARPMPAARGPDGTRGGEGVNTGVPGGAVRLEAYQPDGAELAELVAEQLAEAARRAGVDLP